MLGTLCLTCGSLISPEGDRDSVIYGQDFAAGMLFVCGGCYNSDSGKPVLISSLAQEKGSFKGVDAYPCCGCSFVSRCKRCDNVCRQSSAVVHLSVDMVTGCYYLDKMPLQAYNNCITKHRKIFFRRAACPAILK